jgi:hypothetical protein
MSSTDGCGAEDISRSIQTLCQQCKVQATDQGQKDALKTKCDAILASAPAASFPQRLYEQSSRTEGMSKMQSIAGMSPLTLGVCGLVIAGLSLTLVISALRGQRSAFRQQDSEHTQTNPSDSEICMLE